MLSSLIYLKLKIYVWILQFVKQCVLCTVDDLWPKHKLTLFRLIDMFTQHNLKIVTNVWKVLNILQKTQKIVCSNAEHISKNQKKNICLKKKKFKKKTRSLFLFFCLLYNLFSPMYLFNIYYNTFLANHQSCYAFCVFNIRHYECY